ncbi:hypothetical protein EV368DRAFT_46300 [Lentinula lateritia]|uniref:Uncharacterized protein n=1 Tax=Lentinula aff. lateritia TaxID=2804960 RepID=A0ACC1TUE4_9AGAR|nr:hypothetical protein F5876DRAFT_79066 [Lentinula aff. lateritia]KAJ3849940.1 hypothetical protein EV368DRAFT_46300 [Lentinula lateritia]
MIIEGLSPGPLPPPKAIEHKFQTPGHSNAYNSVYNFHQRVLGDEASVIRARVLGFLLIITTNDTVRAEVVSTVVSCSNDSALDDLGEVYLDIFIRPFKKYKGSRTSTFQSHPSRPSFDFRQQEIKPLIHQAPDNHKKAKDLALYRDGYRCVATQVFEVNYAVDGDPKDYADIQQFGATATNCAHIIPASTYFKLSNESKKDYAASVLAVLARFEYNVENLNGPKIHSLFNVMTLVTVMRDYFDQLKLWFEATITPHRYEIKCLNPFEPVLRNLPSPFTTFATSEPQLPLPDPALLALHASCAKVAYLSGAGEHIDRVHRDLRRLDVLAEDGGSSDVLFHALYALSMLGLDR